jgi:hypothetical protein
MTLKKWMPRIGRVKSKSIKWIKTHPDRLIAFLSLLVTSVLTIFALTLTIKSNSINANTLLIAQHQDKTSIDINHFNSLLKKTNVMLSKDSELVVNSSIQINTLVSLNRTLIRQLQINEQTQEYQNQSLKSKKLADILAFKNSGLQLIALLGYHRFNDIKSWDIDYKNNLYNRIGVLLDKALENPEAAQVDSIFRYIELSKQMVDGYFHEEGNSQMADYRSDKGLDSTVIIKKNDQRFIQSQIFEIQAMNQIINKTADDVYKYASELENKFRKNSVNKN